MYGLIARRALASAGGGVLLLYAASGIAQQAPAPVQIVIDNFAFAPATLTVPVGTPVTWLNKDEEPHTVMSTDQQAGFKSQALDTNDKFTFTFNKPGTYKYFCTIHAHMVGTVVVR